MSNVKHLLQRGFTVVELLVIAPIVILTIGAFITVIVNMTGEVLATRASGFLAYGVQDSLNRIEDDIKLSTTFLAETNITLTSPQGYGNSTTSFTNVDVTKGNMLILNALATIGNPYQSSNGLVYLTNLPNSCTSADVNQNKPMTYNIVYFVENSTLWRRTLMPSDYTTAGCSVPWQKPSCNPNQSGAFCVGKDIRLLDNVDVSDFVVQYFNTASATVPNTIASDTTATVSARNAALQSATSVGVSLNIDATAAGRAINQSAALRATKSDVNASVIGVAPTPTTPVAPSITAAITTPASVVFNWPASPGATGYTFQYQLNGTGGAWTTAFTNQNNKTYTVDAKHLDVVYGRVTATNTAGTSGYSNTASATIPLFATPALQNNWTDYNNGYNTAGYTKTSDGLVVLKGMVKRFGAYTSGETMFVLPAGYRPDKAMHTQAMSADLGATVVVWPDGRVTPTTNINIGWVSLESIAFQSSTSSYSWTNMTLQNSWTNRGQTDDPSMSYIVDGMGRVQTRGSITGGTYTNGTILTSLAVAIRPPQYQHVAVRSGSGGENEVGLDETGAIVAKGVAPGSAYFINTIYYPASYAGWSTLTLQNSWVWYGTRFATVQYTKSADGVVMLKGLIKSGTVTSGTIIGNLPVGYRPAATVLYDSICADLICRLDIQSNGNIIARSGVSATWTSLDTIRFVAEQ